MSKKFLISLVIIVATVGIGSWSLTGMVNAQTIPTSDFSVEVSPSPLAATVQPGKSATIELKIRNASTKQERYKIESRSFTISQDSQAVKLSDSAPAEMKDWIHYSNPTFTVDPGAWFVQRITIKLPNSAGFTYPFAVVISRAGEHADNIATEGGRILKGSVAVFALINIDKPGATRKLELSSFTTSQPVYEYLPATLKLKLKNTGNSIVQPYGNFYIQRGSTTETTLGVLPVNDTQGYIMPGKSREITADWRDGFPVFTKEGSENVVDWTPESNAQFRIGQYTAKVVAVYNDGTRDIPIVGEVSFWVIPWRILLVILIILVVLGFGIWSLVRRVVRKLRRPKPHLEP